MASRKQAERRRFITRKTDPDVPAFLPDVTAGMYDDGGPQRGRQPTRVTTSNTGSDARRSFGPAIGDDSDRVSAFVRVIPKSARNPPQLTQIPWRSADNLSASDQQQQQQSLLTSPPTVRTNSRLKLQTGPVWSPPTSRRQASCDRAQIYRGHDPGGGLRPRRAKAIVTTCTPDLVRSAIGFRPIRRDSQEDSESSASVSGGRGDSGSGYEQTTVRRKVNHKPMPTVSSSNQTQLYQISALPPDGSYRSRTTEHQSATTSGLSQQRPKPWTSTSISTHQPQPVSQWQPSQKQQQQQMQQLQRSELGTPSRLAIHRVSASSGGSASSYDNVERPPTPPHHSSSSIPRSNNVEIRSDSRGRKANRKSRGTVSMVPPIAAAAAAAAEASRRRRYGDEVIITSEPMTAIPREASPVPAPVHRLPRVNTWTSQGDDNASKFGDISSNSLSVERRNSNVGVSGSTFQFPSSTSSGSAIAAWRLQTGNGGLVSSGTSGHSRVVAPHMFGVYDPPKETMSRLRVVSSDSVDVGVDSSLKASAAITFQVDLHPEEVSAASLLTVAVSSSPVLQQSISLTETSLPRVYSPKIVCRDSSCDVADDASSGHSASMVVIDEDKLTADSRSTTDEASLQNDIAEKLSETESSDKEKILIDNIPDEVGTDKKDSETQQLSDEKESEQEQNSCEQHDVTSSDEEADNAKVDNITDAKIEDEEPKADESSSRSSSCSSSASDQGEESAKIKKIESSFAEAAIHETSCSEHSSSLSSSSSSSSSETQSKKAVSPSSEALAQVIVNSKPIEARATLRTADRSIGCFDRKELTEEINSCTEDNDVNFGGSKENILGLMSLNKIVAECTAGGSVAEKVHILSSGVSIGNPSSSKRPGRLPGDIINRLLTGSSQTADGATSNQQTEVKSTSWIDDSSALDSGQPNADSSQKSRSEEIFPLNDATVEASTDSFTSNNSDKPCINSPSTKSHNPLSPSRKDFPNASNTIQKKDTDGNVKPVVLNPSSPPSGRTVSSVVERFTKSDHPGYSSTSHVIRSFAIPTKMAAALSGEATPLVGTGGVGKVSARIQAMISGDKAKPHLVKSSETTKKATCEAETSKKSCDASSPTSEKKMDNKAIADCERTPGGVVDSNDVKSSYNPTQKLSITADEAKVSQLGRNQTCHDLEHRNLISIKSEHKIEAVDGTISDTSIPVLREGEGEIQPVQLMPSKISTATDETVTVVSQGNGSPTTQLSVDTLVLCKPLLTKIVASSSKIGSTSVETNSTSETSKTMSSSAVTTLPAVAMISAVVHTTTTTTVIAQSVPILANNAPLNFEATTVSSSSAPNSSLTTMTTTAAETVLLSLSTSVVGTTTAKTTAIQSGATASIGTSSKTESPSVRRESATGSLQVVTSTMTTPVMSLTMTTQSAPRDDVILSLVEQTIVGKSSVSRTSTTTTTMTSATTTTSSAAAAKSSTSALPVRRTESIVEEQNIIDILPPSLGSPMLSPNTLLFLRSRTTSSSGCSAIDGEISSQTPKTKVTSDASSVPCTIAASTSTAAVETSTVCVLARLSPAAPTKTAVSPVRRQDMPISSAGPIIPHLEPILSCSADASSTKTSDSANTSLNNKAPITTPGIRTSKITDIQLSPARLLSPSRLKSQLFFPPDDSFKARSPKPLRSPSSNVHTAFPFTSTLPSQQVIQTKSTVDAESSPTVAEKLKGFPLHPSTNTLLAEGSNVMAALDDALAVLTSVVMEKCTDNTAIDNRITDKSHHPENQQLANKTNKQTDSNATTKNLNFPAIELVIPLRKTVQPVAEPVSCSSNIPNRFVVDSSHPIVHRRLAPPDVVAGIEEGERRRREIEAAENRRRRWHDSRGRPEEDSFNRHDPDEDSPHSTSPTPRQSATTTKLFLPLPSDSVILRHRRRTRKQKKQTDLLKDHEQRSATVTSTITEKNVNVEDKIYSASSSTSSCSELSDQVSSSRPKRRTYNGRRVTDGTVLGQRTSSAPTGETKCRIAETRSTAAELNSVSKINIGKVTPSSAPTKRRQILSSSSKLTKSRVVEKSRSADVRTSEKPMIVSTSNDYRQRIDYG